QRVRDDEPDEADEAGERDGGTGEEGGRADDRDRRALRIHAERCGRLLAEDERVAPPAADDPGPAAGPRDDGRAPTHARPPHARPRTGPRGDCGTAPEGARPRPRARLRRAPPR